MLFQETTGSETANSTVRDSVSAIEIETVTGKCFVEPAAAIPNKVVVTKAFFIEDGKIILLTRWNSDELL